MNKLHYSVIVLLAVLASTTCFAEEEVVFDLFPQARPYIYAVGFKHEGKDLWYQLQWAVMKDTWSVTQTCDVFYDAISENFYCAIGNDITIIPMNRKYKLKFHKTEN